MPITVIIPFFNGHATIRRLLESLPPTLPVVIVDDHSDLPLRAGHLPTERPAQIVRPLDKGYFAGAVNAGLQATRTDVLVLNQDVWFELDGWLALLQQQSADYGMIGDGVFDHPAWPRGYVQGTFMYLRRDLINRVGMFNRRQYPLWGCTADYQVRACRHGYKALPLESVPGLRHERKVGEPFGSSIRETIRRSPDMLGVFTRTPPAVSVVIPCFNYGRFLPDAVASLIGGATSLGNWPTPGQTLQAFEVIIVDDASTDETQEIGRSLADPWRGVRYIRLADSGHQDGGPNNGTPLANNVGIDAAFGPVIAMMSADDMMAPDRLERMYRVMKAEEGEGRSVAVYDDPQLFGHGQRRNVMALGSFNPAKLLEKNHVHAGIMFRKADWQRVGGYPAAMRYGREDWAFNVALCGAGVCFVKAEGAGYLYRREGHNRTERNTTPDWQARFRAQMADLFPALYSGERKMACCSGNPRSTLGVEGMTYLKYTGANHGSSSWWGEVTQARYQFNGKGDVQAVDSRDVPWFLNQYEGATKLFEVADDEAAEVDVVPPEDVPPPHLVAVVDTKGGEAVTVDLALPPALRVGISEMTVDELDAHLASQPDRAAAAVMLADEQVGRKRKTVIGKLEAYLAGE